MSGREADGLAASATPGEDEAHAGFVEGLDDDATSMGDKRSVIDDIEALIDDARTYLDAELSYQKTRAAFVADCLKKGIGFILLALVIVFFAAIGLTVGLVIALTPILTAWGATALVVLVYVFAALLLARAAARAFKAIQMAINPDGDQK